jgi:hypothetical protein
MPRQRRADKPRPNAANGCHHAANRSPHPFTRHFTQFTAPPDRPLPAIDRPLPFHPAPAAPALTFPPLD